MAAVRWTASAARDLEAILDFKAEQSAASAERLVRKLDKKVRLYAKWPRMGGHYPGLPEHIRCMLVEKLIVFYREHDRGILLLRILHGSRDIPAHFEDDPGE